MIDHKMKPPENSDLRKFGLIMAIAFGGVIGLLVPWYFNKNYHPWLWVLGASFLTLGLLWPASLRPVHALWMRIGLILGKINSRIILTLVYWIFIVPMALFFRATGRDHLKLKRDSKENTFRQESRQREMRQGQGEGMRKLF